MVDDTGAAKLAPCEPQMILACVSRGAPPTEVSSVATRAWPSPPSHVARREGVVPMREISSPCAAASPRSKLAATPTGAPLELKRRVSRCPPERRVAIPMSAAIAATGPAKGATTVEAPKSLRYRRTSPEPPADTIHAFAPSGVKSESTRRSPDVGIAIACGGKHWSGKVSLHASTRPPRKAATTLPPSGRLPQASPGAWRPGVPVVVPPS